MASPASLAEYEQDRIEVIEDLKLDGFLGSFGSDYINDNDRESVTEYKAICEEYYFQLENADNFKDIIQETDQVFIVSNQSNDLLKDCDFMGGNHRKKIVEIKSFPVGLANPIYYEILVRG